MARPHKCSVDVKLPFCEDELRVTVTGTLYPYVPMRGPSYASGGEPPEPATFEYEKVEWYDAKATKMVDITAMIPTDQETYVSDSALQAYSDGGYGDPDPDAALEDLREREHLRGRR